MNISPEPKLILPRHGWIVQVIPFVVSLTAFILSASAVSSCRFLLYERGDSTRGLIGLFRNGAGDVCSTVRHARAIIDNFNENSQTTRLSLPVELQVAEAGGILACLLGFTSVCLIFSAFFSKRTVTYQAWRIIIPIITLVAFVTQLMTFALFGTDECATERGSTTVVTCSFDEGANYAFAASILYLSLGIGIIFFPRRSSPLCSFPDGIQDDIEAGVGLAEDKKKHDDYDSEPRPPRQTRPTEASEKKGGAKARQRGSPPQPQPKEAYEVHYHDSDSEA